MPVEPITCPDCNGGYIGDEVCGTCIGQGSLPVRRVEGYIKKHVGDMEDKLSDIMNKCNDIADAIEALEPQNVCSAGTKVEAITEPEGCYTQTAYQQFQI